MSWTETLLKPIDRLAMWEKVRAVPGGSELYHQLTPGLPFAKGLGDWWKAYLSSGTDTLPVELEQPLSSLLGRYAVHVPFVDREGIKGPHGLQLRHDAPDVSWLSKAITGQPMQGAGMHTEYPDGGMLDLISTQSEWSVPELLAHESKGHGTFTRLKSQDATTRNQYLKHLPAHLHRTSGTDPQQEIISNLVQSTQQAAPDFREALAQTSLYESYSPEQMANETLAFALADKVKPRALSIDAQDALDNDPWTKAFYRTADERGLHPQAMRQPGQNLWKEIKPSWWPGG